MAANVALSDTFDLWRTRTNQLLMYTQTQGGKDVVHVSNTTNATSTTTGAITSNGGIGILESAVVGGSVLINTNLTVDKDVVITGNTDIGDTSADTLTISARIDADVIPYTDEARNFGNSTWRWGTVHVGGIVGSNSSAAVHVPTGSSAERAGGTGSIRWNTTLSRFEGNTGTLFYPLANPEDQDADTKITTDNGSDEDIIRFFTGNSITESTERMNLGTSGNLAIGMGSTTGDAQLQVSGTVNVGGTSNFGNRVNLRGNTYIYDSAEWCNVAPSNWFHIHTPDTTIDSENVIITGNLVVQGTRTYNDTAVTVTEDKTFVIGLAGNVYSDSDASSGTITSQRNNATENHGLSVSDKVFIVVAGTSGLTDEGIYIVATVPTVTTFTLTGYSGTGTFDWAKCHTDAQASGGGLVIPATTKHSFTYESSLGAWLVSDGGKVNGAFQVTGTSDFDGDLDIDAAVVHDGTFTHAGAFKTTADTTAAANYFLKSADAAGTSSWVAFGIYDSSGTRLGP